MRIVIIGGVAAGMSAAAKAKRMAKNSEVIVYEKGSIVSFGACGLPYYVGDFFDNPQGMIARTPEQFRESGVEVNINHGLSTLIATGYFKTPSDNFIRRRLISGPASIIYFHLGVEKEKQLNK